MDKILFQKITITQIQYINVQQILVVTFEFTDAARGYMIMSCAARGVKKVGQHCWTSIKTESSSIDGFRIINDLKLEFSRLRIQTKCQKSYFSFTINADISYGYFTSSYMIICTILITRLMQGCSSEKEVGGCHKKWVCARRLQGQKCT